MCVICKDNSLKERIWIQRIKALAIVVVDFLDSFALKFYCCQDAGGQLSSATNSSYSLQHSKTQPKLYLWHQHHPSRQFHS